MGEQTFVAYMVTGNKHVSDFYRFDCKRVSTVEKNIRNGMSNGNTGLMSLFRKHWAEDDVVACEIYSTPGGDPGKGKLEKRIIMDWAMTMGLRDWYHRKWPRDEIYREIREDAVFAGLMEAINTGRNVYEYIGVSDSFVRERLFVRLAEVTGHSYKDIYNKWLGM